MYEATEKWNSGADNMCGWHRSTALSNDHSHGDARHSAGRANLKNFVISHPLSAVRSLDFLM
ncbi:hypothetical protein [Cohaesibacter celericrescens]|uniref:hypothetical protein n=1 Tax=Cohaesibacter celericrescens TaxID=2067669 RepID=UPI0035645B2C